MQSQTQYNAENEKFKTAGIKSTPKWKINEALAKKKLGGMCSRVKTIEENIKKYGFGNK